MQKQFVQYINRQKLFSKTDKVLVAVSGGADSVVLLHLLKQCSYKLAIAHCNFKLRGNESDSDEQFVKQLAKEYGVKAHFISFETEEFAKKNKLSIEMAARDLRYNWFNELVTEYKYNYVATGHHLNDSIETLFLNLARGTGYNGLNGIAPKNGVVVRPLLFATKQDIERYADNNNLLYRNDSSNESEKHLRNIVRKQIVPAFKKINPGFEQVMISNFNHLNEAASLLNAYFNEFASDSLKKTDAKIEIPFVSFKAKEPQKIHLFHLIKDFGFNKDAVTKIINAINAGPGKMFYSETHCILVDREALIISEIAEKSTQSYVIESIDDFESLPINVVATLINNTDFELIKKNNIACIDNSKLQYPLILRKWKQGDYFYPLGMTQKKKLSDFLIDTKVNRIDKENVWVLTSNKEIVWVVNRRLDNRFKLTENSKDILLLDYQI